MNYLMILIIQMMNKYMLKISFILINFILFKIYKTIYLIYFIIIIFICNIVFFVFYFSKIEFEFNFYY